MIISLASWRRIVALIIRETLAIWRDKQGRLILVLPPIMQLLVFSYAATFELYNAPLAILNEDMGVASRELIARFTSAGAFETKAILSNGAEIAPVIDNADVLAVLRIGPTFSRDLLSGKSPDIQLIIDGRQSNTALVALSYVNGIIEDFSLEQAALHGNTLPQSIPRLVSRAWYNPNLDSKWFIIPGLVGTLTMIVALTTTAMSVARERELGTFEQLLVTPLRPLEILIGKIMPSALIGLGEGLLLALLGVLIFHVPFRGSILLLVFALAIFLLSVTMIGLMISTFTSSQQQAMITSFAVSMPFAILSGLATPLENMPAWVQWLTYLNPLRYVTVITRGVFLQDMPWSVAFANLWPMALIGVITALVAMRLFRSRLG